MAKMKVHELAKEFDITSKEVLTFLQEKGIEAKAAQSSVEDDAIDMVRKAFANKGDVKATVGVRNALGVAPYPGHAETKLVH